MTFVLDYDISNIKPAEYNPRKIDEHSFQLLVESIKLLGITKPVIVSKDRIIAGHQRTKAAQSLGLSSIPVFQIQELQIEDEIRFNQLHNGTDYEIHILEKLMPFEHLGYQSISYNSYQLPIPKTHANLLYEINRLLVKYGNWGCCVAAQDGRIISGALYLIACSQLKINPRIFVLSNNLHAIAATAFSKQYGVYHYSHLPKRTYHQSYAQMFRLRGKVKSQKSTLYETCINPVINQSHRILDFGCGQGDYVKALAKQGYSIIGYEPYTRLKNAINISQVHRQVDALVQSLEVYGLFDVVIADSVLNSINSLEDQHHVLTCLNALCKPNGMIFFSGRTFEREHGMTKMSRQKDDKGYLHFFDADNFSAIYRNGNWFYQKYHSRQQIESLCQQYIGASYTVIHSNHRTSWQAYGAKSVTVNHPELSLAYEFNLLYPDNSTLNRHDDIVKAYSKAIAYATPDETNT